MTASEFTFVVDATPVAQPRHRVGAARFGGGRGRAYVPARHPIHTWKLLVAARGRQARPKDWAAHGSMALTCVFVMPRPRRLSGDGGREPHTAKPDADNLVKAVKDALNGVCWHDDAQVVQLSVTKVYAAHDEQPHALVRVQKMEGTDVV